MLPDLVILGFVFVTYLSWEISDSSFPDLLVLASECWGSIWKHCRNAISNVSVFEHENKLRMLVKLTSKCFFQRLWKRFWLELLMKCCRICEIEWEYVKFVERERREVRGVKLEFDGCAPLMFLFFLFIKKRFAWIMWRKFSALVGPVVQMNLYNRVDGIATV